jgi:hypothetical protein
MTEDLHKWGRLFAAFAILLGISYSLISSVPDVSGTLSGFKADLLWPALVLGAAAIGFGVVAFSQQRRRAAERREP